MPRSSQCRFRFPVPFHWATGAVESARLELASPGCRPGILPLKYDPAGREGIEPSLRVLEARPVTMTLRPKNGDSLAAFAERLVRELNPSHSVDSGAATPVASRGIILRVPGRTRTCIVRFRKPTPLPFGHEDRRGGDVRESNPSPSVHSRPSSQTSNVTVMRA